MTRLEQLMAENTMREKAEILLNLVCSYKTDCNHNCDQCTRQIEDYLNEDIGDDEC